MDGETEGDSQGIANLGWGLQVLLWSCYLLLVRRSERTVYPWWV
jgi:hypothetical protein